MQKFRENKTKIFIAVIAVVTAIGGMTINWDGEKIVVAQSAVGQVSDEDLIYLERANRAFINLINSATPAVVKITTTRRISDQRKTSPFEDPFDFFFDRPRPNSPHDPREIPDTPREVPNGIGSGVIVNPDGYILTNHHVIRESAEISVILPDGRQFTAELIGSDAGSNGTDLAVLKISGRDLPFIKFGNSDDLQVGEWVVAIGSPFGLSQTVTRGIVSAKGRSTNDVGIASYADFIQTDASINRGNSGGGLINIRGELVGINTAIATGGGFNQGNVGVGFSIPSNLARNVMEQLIEKGEVERGWLGIQFQEIDYDLSEKLDLDKPRGALVTIVGRGSPADKGGIRHGDVILKFDDVPIRNGGHLRHVVASTPIGKTVTVRILRREKNSEIEKDLKIKLAKRTEKAISALTKSRTSPSLEDADREIFSGIEVQDLTDHLAEKFNHKDEVGVIVSNVENGSPAEMAGIRVGDLIMEIDWVAVKNLDDYRKRLKDLKNESKVTLYVRHETGQPEFITIDVSKN